MPIYQIFNGPFPTTAAQAPVTTGTVIKTLLQVKGVTGVLFRIVEWGISFDGSAAATPIKCELVETGTVFGTVTASAAADIVKFGDPNAPTSTVYFSVGTAATGYTATAEGTITATRVFDAQLIAPTNQYVKQYPLGREPVVNADSALRIRVTAGAAVNAYCYVTLEV
jgi:hypothetical protein